MDDHHISSYLDRPSRERLQKRSRVRIVDHGQITIDVGQPDFHLGDIVCPLQWFTQSHGLREGTKAGSCISY